MRLHSYGIHGRVDKGDESRARDLVYLVQDYFPSVELFEMVHKIGAMGEDMGRHLLR